MGIICHHCYTTFELDFNQQHVVGDNNTVDCQCPFCGQIETITKTEFQNAEKLEQTREKEIVAKREKKKTISCHKQRKKKTSFETKYAMQELVLDLIDSETTECQYCCEPFDGSEDITAHSNYVGVKCNECHRVTKFTFDELKKTRESYDDNDDEDDDKREKDWY
ncbi:MAG: hypothetical protein WC976_06335 [Caldisericia bacterium]